MSSVFEQLTSLRQRQLTPVLLAYLKQSQASGSTCGSNSGSLSTCLWACFGKFSIYVDYEDLRGLIEGFGSVSGALDRAVSWFTVKLLPLLPSLTPEMLQTVTSNADCDAYHVIVGALRSVFEQLTSLRQRQLTPVLLAYLKQSQASGSTCGSNSGSLSTCLWACFGKCSIYVDYEDLRGLIEGFGSCFEQGLDERLKGGSLTTKARARLKQRGFGSACLFLTAWTPARLSGRLTSSWQL
ncbi:hypothetical protein ROHU_035127 [Labeo rohita]|uniref:Uncharacterized protein n=1 Tax=Labeo rohita TaxID=84645 RepID=A0A498LSF2_LABRO|nr:hypothetical protein ROHU_035127 [Labeo rohita]